MENTWISINKVFCSEVKSFVKCELHFRKHLDICFLIGELIFISSDMIDNEILISMPDISTDFAPCENTILALKNDDTRVMLHVSISKGLITIQGFPFEPSCKYELNLQFFMRITTDNLKK